MNLLHAWIVPPEAHAEPWLYILSALGALGITAVSKGGFGGGVGIVAVPLMMQVAPARFVIGLWLPLLIACDLATIHHYPKQWSPRAVALLAPGMLLGIAGATLLLWSLERPSHAPEARHQEAWLKLGVAVIAFVFVILKYGFPARRERNPPKVGEEVEKPWRPTWAVSLPLGFFAGICTTLAHAAGTLVTMFLLPQKLEKRVFVGTTGRFYCFFNSLKIPFMIAIGVVTWSTLKYGLWLMLLAPLGVWLGSWLNRRLEAAWFVRLIYLFLVLASGKLVYDWWATVF